MKQCGEAGRHAADVRSDAYVRIEIGGDHGLELDINSKVQSMYGEAIKRQTTEMLQYFAIENARITIHDSGALPFTLAARIEAAVRRALPQITKEYRLPPLPQTGITGRDRLRRSRLYLPGNEPKFMINAGLHQADGIILDLEDSVAPGEKDAARVLVRNALDQIDFGEAERMVRINQLPEGLCDLPYVVPHNIQLILIPKCESAAQVEEINQQIKKLAPAGHSIWLMPIIESALGVINAYQIASAAPEIVALSIGLEDYTADLGTQRSQQGSESFVARCQIVNAARAAGIQAIDSVFSDVADMEGLRASVVEAKSLGFEGKGCIHPRQIAVIHQAFAPGEQELEKAKRVVQAFQQAQKQGLSVVTLGSKMIDPPVVKRALKTVQLAQRLRILAPNWQEQAG